MLQFYHMKEFQLWKMIEEVEARAKAKYGRRKSLMLPLLPCESNSPVEIKLGAAIALADEEAVNIILEDCPVSPGLALAKLSVESIYLIRNVFEKKWIYPVRMEDLQKIFHLALHDPTAQSGGPALITLESFNRANSRITDLVTSLGLYIFSVNDFELKLDIRKMDKLPRMKFTLGRYGSLQGNLYVTNFCCSFSVPVYLSEQGGVKFLLTDIRLEEKGSRPSIPDRELAMSYFATVMAYQTANIAANRLRKLQTLTDQQSLSLEHIAVTCGFENDSLHVMEQGDLALINHNRTKIFDAVETTLGKYVPCPDRPYEITSHAPSAALKIEIHTFTQDYVKLLHLSYCEIPKIRGKPPSRCVHETRVGDQATDGFLKSTPLAFHRIRRKYEKNERER
jgi:hypothetical protein